MIFQIACIKLVKVARHMTSSSGEEIASLEHLSFLGLLLKGREHIESSCGFVPISSLSQLCSDKPGCTSLPGKSSF